MQRTYGTDVSLQKRQKIRLSESFESYAQCKDRNLKTNKNMRNHIGTVSWYSNGCLKKVESYGPEINAFIWGEGSRKGRTPLLWGGGGGGSPSFSQLKLNVCS